MNNYQLIELKFDQAKQPKFEEKKGAGYVKFGEENEYPKYLLSLYNESSKHGGIVKGKVNYIYGKGFEQDFKCNSQGETWNNILKKCVKDDELYRGYYLQIIWNKLKQIAEIYHIEFAKVRVSKDLSEYYVKNDWSDMREKARVYPAFNVNEPFGSQIFYYKEYNPSNEVYPFPSYFQALNFIEADIQVSRHILGNSKQGFVGSKLINLNNGDPIGEEHKEEVERGILKKFTGSEGKRVVIMFNKSRDNAAEILDLGQTMLTKEDFTNVNNLIQMEIFAGHQITSSQLFGIPGTSAFSRNELRDAYEIFNKTYVQERQGEFNQIFTKLRNYKGEAGEFAIVPVEPLGFEFSEAIIAANLTQNEIRAMMGREPLQIGEVTTTGKIVDNVAVKAEEVKVNDSLKNLTGRQHQNIMRIVRNFSKGNISKEQASLMLKNGFGLNDSEINTFLGIEETPLTDFELQKFSANPDDSLIYEFSNTGDLLADYQILSERPTRDIFAEISTLNQLEANVLGLIEKDKRVTPEVIAKTLNTDVDVVDEVLKKLFKQGVIKEKVTKVGLDESIERIIEKPLADLKGKKPSDKITELMIRYVYSGPEDDRNRPFCAKMMQLAKTKIYSRSQIEAISERLGYSVWDRRGGWFTQPDGIHRPYCRHEWKTLIVKKK